MPSPIIQHPTIGYLHAGADKLQHQLRHGNGTDWPGDDRLSLALRVIEHPNPKFKHIHGRRYEVWRNMEDGRFEMISHWTLEEFDRILPDMVLARMDSPAWVSALDRIDANNAKIEQANADRYVDRMGPMMEHLHSLKKHHSPHETQDVFYMHKSTKDA